MLLDVIIPSCGVMYVLRYAVLVLLGAFGMSAALAVRDTANGELRGQLELGLLHVTVTVVTSGAVAAPVCGGHAKWQVKRRRQ